MKNLQKKALNIIAKAGMKIALKANGRASDWSIYQPKEPEALKKYKK